MRDCVIELSHDVDNLTNQLNENLEKKMVLILGRCSAFFDGRIKSHYSDGDRVLIIKKDSTILVHGSSGVKPVQWQLPGAGKVSFKMIDENLRMETYRPKTDESFFVTFSKVYHALTFNTEGEDTASAMIGHEKDFVDYLIKNPDVIEHGIQIIESEKEIDFGFIDIWACDSAQNLVAIEVKRSPATLADAMQVKRYVDFFQNQGQTIRGILIATKFPKKVLNYLDAYGLEPCLVHWQDIFPTLIRPSSIPTSKRLDEFF